MEIIPFSEEQTFGHWFDTRLEGYIYKDLLDIKIYNQIKNLVVSILSNSIKDTFLTHNSVFIFNGKEIKIASHKQNDREQNVLFDWTFDKDWFYQTQNTVKSWSENKLLNEVSPYFIKVIKKIESLPPINNEKEKWICYRLHINYLEYEKFLSPHIDSASMNFNTKNQSEARIYSVTYYLHDHVEGYGGELYSINGFVYKPVSNSAILINGNKVVHGVTQNKNPDKKPRLAFTMRFVHIDDLFLPGHPDKLLYKTYSI